MLRQHQSGFDLRAVHGLRRRQLALVLRRDRVQLRWGRPSGCGIPRPDLLGRCHQRHRSRQLLLLPQRREPAPTASERRWVRRRLDDHRLPGGCGGLPVHRHADAVACQPRAPLPATNRGRHRVRLLLLHDHGDDVRRRSHADRVLGGKRSVRLYRGRLAPGRHEHGARLLAGRGGGQRRHHLLLHDAMTR